MFQHTNILRQIREIIQTYLVIVFTTIEVFLISRFCIDFFGTQSQNALLTIVINISNFLLKPFYNTFTSYTVDGSTLDYSTLYAIVIYTLSGIITFKLFKIILKSELSKKSLELTGLIFLSLEGLIVLRIASDIFDANHSPFNKLVYGFSNLFIKPLSLLTSITGEISNTIASVAAMILIGILWFTVYKIVEGLSEGAKKLEQQVSSQKEYTPSQPVETFASQEQESQDQKVTSEQPAIRDPGQGAQPQEIQPVPRKKDSPKFLESIKKDVSNSIKPESSEKSPFKKTSKDGQSSRESPLA